MNARSTEVMSVQPTLTVTGVLRLAMEWELEALALDAVRFRSESKSERDSLRESAEIYRRCAAELTATLNVARQ